MRAALKNRIPQQQIVGYAAGDRDAFEFLFRRLHRTLFFTVRRFFASPFDQEEALQEVWLHLYRMRRQVDVNRPDEFVAWVKRVARNRCIDLFKSRGRKTEIPVEQVGELADKQGGSERAVVNSRVRAALEPFIAELDEEERRFFKLCFVEERAHAEIADMLEINVRRSKYLKKKLLQRLLRSAPLREIGNRIDG